MKIPAAKGIIIVRDNQQLAKHIEWGVAPGQRNVHVVETDRNPRQSRSPKEIRKNRISRKNVRQKGYLWINTYLTRR